MSRWMQAVIRLLEAFAVLSGLVPTPKERTPTR